MPESRALLILCLLLSASPVLFAQQGKPEPSPDVVRVDTNLVQTNVVVLDKKGVFVDGLRLEDFEFKVDGKPVPVSFFSRIAAGTSQELATLASAKTATAVTPTTASEDFDERSRMIVFFIDDLHLSASSVQRTRQVIQYFLNSQMGASDQVAIASASGQIGFLQQFTDNKSVLRAALARLNHRPYTVIDSESISMTEYTALRVDQGDRDAITYYTNQLLLANNFRSPGGNLGPPASAAVGRTPAQNQRTSGLSREMAERMVKERALVLIKESTAVTTNTLIGLESLIRTAAQHPGRKLVFFVSDGFYLNDRNTAFVNKVHELTDAAVRAGVVIYSLDARGLQSTIDATSNRPDPEGKLSRSNVGELSASQDGLNALAEDTGGHALFDSERLTEAVERGLQETSNYYLFAWRPASEAQTQATFKRIEVSVVGRPELTVRRPRGYLALEQNVNAAVSSSLKPAPREPQASHAEPPADVELRNALNAAAPVSTVPTSVAASFVDTPDNGLVVTASAQAAASALDYGPDGKRATVDLAGVILNDTGKAAAGFRTRLNVAPTAPEMNQPGNGVVYSYKTKLSPGLYQVRVAVRDETSKKVGSATQWIEVPDLSTQKLTLSSLLLRSQKKGVPTAEDTPFSVDRRLSQASQLGFFLFIYNASRGPQRNSRPDVTAQVQLFRRGQAIVTTPVRTLSVEGMTDLARIPYAGQFPLDSLAKGLYELQITITDKLANASASQRVSFRIE